MKKFIFILKSKKLVLGFVFAVAAFAVADAQVKAFVGHIGISKELTFDKDINDIGLSIQALQGDKFNTLDELNKIKDFIYNELSKEFPFTLLPENDVLWNEKYQDFVVKSNAQPVYDGKLSEEIPWLVPEGYLIWEVARFPTWPLRHARPADIIPLFEGVNAVMNINISIRLEPDGMLIAGNGRAKARIYIHIELINRKYRKLMDIEEHGTSEQSFGIVLGQIVKNRENIQLGFVEASDDLFKQMRKSLPKKIKKFEKKLRKIKM
jgi:hypothetical protein